MDINKLELKNRAIFDSLKTKLRLSVALQIIILEEEWKEKFDIVSIHPNAKKILQNCLYAIKTKWQQARRTHPVFLKNNEPWLDKTIIIPCISEAAKNISKEQKEGCPSKEFEICSDRRKRQKTTEIRSSLTTQELAYATQMSLRSTGATDAASVVKDITLRSPTQATKYKEAYRALSKPQPIEKTPDVALSEYINMQMTKQIYKDSRIALKKSNVFVYPSYEKLVEAKKRCYPDNITVNEVSAEVELQALLNHTCDRILTVQKDIVDSLPSKISNNLTMICKWGCEGSSGQREYKHEFSNDSSSDKCFFLTSLVPLKIAGYDADLKKEIIIWKNPRSSSPRYCRPLSLQFLKETVESTLIEQQHFESQIELLVPFVKAMDGREIVTQFELHFTMNDMKVCNSVTGTKSAMRCYLCNSTSKQFNYLKLMRENKVEPSKLMYGLPTLHCRIRFFECFLDIGYKLTTQKWQARTVDDEEVVEERKRVIQKALKQQLHLIIDQPEPGFGNTNDGNTARRFFENLETASEILGVDLNLMQKASVILQVLSCGFAVDVNAFTSYCHETAETFVQLYPWYCMPTTIHEILIHGPMIVDYSPLPIVQMLEDAQDRNKDIRNYREHNNARKNSREATMQDIFNRLLITSDPLISSLTENHLRKSRSLTPAALKLLSVRLDNSSDESCCVSTGAIAYDYLADDSDDSSDNGDFN